MSRSRTAPARIVKATRRWIGTPYHNQASVRGVGCDCLGLLRGVWREYAGPEPLELTGPVPPYSRDWGEVGPVEVLAEAARAAMIELNIADARSDDVILFRMRAGAIATHCGILSGGECFIHAYERTGVIEEHLTPAWRRRVSAVSKIQPGRPGAGMPGMMRRNSRRVTIRFRPDEKPEGRAAYFSQILGRGFCYLV